MSAGSTHPGLATLIARAVACPLCTLLLMALAPAVATTSNTASLSLCGR